MGRKGTKYNNWNKGDTFSERRTNKRTQFRKHIKQMNQEEAIRCAVLIKDIKLLKRSRHLRLKNSVKFDMTSVYRALKSRYLYRHIVEYNEIYDIRKHRWNQRVLITIPELVEYINNGRKEKGYLKVVIDVTTKEVITVFYNEENDKHETLDLGYYTKTLRIRPWKQGGYGLPNRGLPEDIRDKFGIVV